MSSLEGKKAVFKSYDSFFVHFLKFGCAAFQIGPSIDIHYKNAAYDALFINEKERSFRNAVGAEDAVLICDCSVRPEIR
jgi:hypothetical protein